MPNDFPRNPRQGIYQHLLKVRGAYPTRLILALLVLPLTLFYSSVTLAKSNEPPVFELENKAALCLENCANFTIKIYADGNVHYRGNKVVSRYRTFQLVRILGDRYGKITKSQLAELVDLFESIPVEEVEKKYGHLRDMNGSGGIIIYNNNGKHEKLNFFPFFDLITTKLNSFLNIKKWICFPKKDLNNPSCLLVDRPEYPSFENVPVDPFYKLR